MSRRSSSTYRDRLQSRTLRSEAGDHHDMHKLLRIELDEIEHRNCLGFLPSKDRQQSPTAPGGVHSCITEGRETYMVVKIQSREEVLMSL